MLSKFEFIFKTKFHLNLFLWEMKNTEKIFLVNGVWLVCPSDSLTSESLQRIQKRQKLFVRYAKRFMMGPFLGFVLGFVFSRLQMPMVANVSIGVIVTALGLFLPFKYIKNSYWILLVGLYSFLITQMIIHWKS